MLDIEILKNMFFSRITKIEKNKHGEYIVIEDGIPTGYYEGNEFLWLQEYEKLYPEKIEEYTEPIIEGEDVLKIERAKRDRLLADADKLLLKYKEQVQLGIIVENKEYYTTLLQYKQTLRDIPEQDGFPENITYPTLPKYEDYE